MDRLARFLRLIDEHDGFFTAIGTIVIAGFTVVLALTTIELKSLGEKQAEDTKHSLEIARVAATAAQASADAARLSVTAVQRAFVFPTNIQASRAVSEKDETVAWQFSVRLENSGSTPAANLVGRANIVVNAGDLPASFNFADNATMTPDTPAGIPAKGIGFLIVTRPIAEIEAVIRGQQRMFIWGWIEYDDTFANTPRHRAEYCFEIKIGGDARTDKNNVMTEMYPRHNNQSDIPRSK